MTISRVMILSAGLFGFCSSALAANIQTFTTRQSWQAAAANIGQIDTEDFAEFDIPARNIDSSRIFGGSTGNGVFNGAALPGVSPSPGQLNFGSLTKGVLLSKGTRAVGGDWDLSPGGTGGGIAFTATFADGTTQRIGSITNPSASAAFNGFFGFVSDTPVTGVTYQTGLTGQSELFTLDNLSFVRNPYVTPILKPNLVRPPAVPHRVIP